MGGGRGRCGGDKKSSSEENFGRSRTPFGERGTSAVVCDKHCQAISAFATAEIFFSVSATYFQSLCPDCFCPQALLCVFLTGFRLLTGSGKAAPLELEISSEIVHAHDIALRYDTIH